MSERLKDLKKKFDEAMKKGDGVVVKQLALEIDKVEREMALADSKTVVTLSMPTYLVERLRAEAEAEGLKKGSFGRIVWEAVKRFFMTKMGHKESMLSSEGQAIFKAFLAEKNPDEAQRVLTRLSDDDFRATEIILDSAVLVKSDPVTLEMSLKEAKRLCDIVKSAGEARSKA